MLKSVLAEQHDFKRESSAKWRFWDWCLCLTSFLPCVSIFNFSCENLSQILWYKHHSRIKLEFHVLLAWHGSLWWESAGSLIAVLSRGCRQNSISLLSIFWWVLLFFFFVLTFYIFCASHHGLNSFDMHVPLIWIYSPSYLSMQGMAIYLYGIVWVKCANMENLGKFHYFKILKPNCTTKVPLVL